MPDQFGDARIRVTLDTSQMDAEGRRLEAQRQQEMGGDPSSRRRNPWRMRRERPEVSEGERLHDFLTGDRMPRPGRGARSPRGNAQAIDRMLRERIERAVASYVQRIPVIGPLAARAGSLARSAGGAARGAGAGAAGGAAARAGTSALSKAGAVGAIVAAAKFAWDYGPQGVTLWPTGLAAFQGAGVLPANPGLEKAFETLRADFITLKSNIQAILPAMSYTKDVSVAALKIGGGLPNLVKMTADAQAVIAEEEAVRQKFALETADQMAETLGANIRKLVNGR